MLGRGEFEKRYLPRPAALGIAVEVELVGDEDADVGVLALAQRHVRDDFRRRADDGCRCVDRCVAGDHSDIVPPPKVAMSSKNFSETSALSGAV